MQYRNPDIESSYRENDIGRTLYDLVLRLKPKKIVEFGILYGYSTVAMAMALDELGSGHIRAYDLFEDYPFKHGSMEGVAEAVRGYGLSKYVTLEKKNFDDWLAAPEPFDLLHVDVSNKGDTIARLYESVSEKIAQGATVVFEGGSEERDNVEWMIKYNAVKINDSGVPFKVIDSRFPSLSMLVSRE